MLLKIIEHEIKSVILAEKSGYKEGILSINPQECKVALTSQVSYDYDIEFAIAKPGECKRIIHVTDIIRPSYKESEGNFPGWISNSSTGCGMGTTHQAANLCITQSFCYPGIQEGIIDLFLPGANYSVFSKNIHLVIVIKLLKEKVSKEILAKDLIQMNVQAAVYIGSILAEETDGREFIYDNQSEMEGLPKIGYAYFIQAQGPLRNVHYMGENCVQMQPRLVEPQKILDGAIVSGNYIIACQKNPTYLHQRNPVIDELFSLHGKSLLFQGVIISTESSSLEQKQENAKKIAEIAKELCMDGILVTQEGGGHADVDLMTTCDACEEKGIKTVLLSNEIAGTKGELPPLVANSNRADAVVSTGNNDEVIRLPKAETVIGYPAFIQQTKDAHNELTTPLGIMYTSTNQLGATAMTTEVY
ncbi:glycine/sarcosine/betaine reductase component B subunit [Roseburia hominis]